MAAPRKTIGVLTFHRCINYGSYWQARCLLEGLGAGGDAILLDHESRAVTRKEWRCAVEPRLPARSSPQDRRAYAAKTRRFLDAAKGLRLSGRFPLDDPRALEPFDVIVVGSDEVWNFSHPWYGGKAIFFGEGLRAERIVSYAASFGNHGAEHGLDPWWAEKLRRFASISVRDENSAALLRAALGLESEIVLDPCLQFPEVVPREPDGAEAPYLAVYGHSFPAWFAAEVRRFAEAEGLRLVSIGYRNEWADRQMIDASPESFARLMAGASAVATNFFHGCVFALLNRKPFVCIGSSYRANKVRDLTRALGAERHLVGADAPVRDLGDLLGSALDGAIGRRIEALRASSAGYLAGALG